MEPQAEVCPVPVSVLQIRRGGEIIQFHLFHQERPWHGGAAPTHTHTHTHSQTQSIADGLASVVIRPLHTNKTDEPGRRLSSDFGGGRELVS